MSKRHNVADEQGVRVMAEMCETCIFRRPEVPSTPCVEWDGARTSSGYGVRRVGNRLVRVHRLAWEEANGPIPPAVIVMHKCDNPPCYRLDHLVLGSHKDNSDDKFSKGRANTLRGEATGRARLSTEQVYEVRARIEQGESQRSIASSLGVSAGAIQHIAEGRNWRHLLPMGTKMQLRPARLAQMVTEAKANEGTIVCHDTLDKELHAACRGFFDRHATQPLQIAERLGMVIPHTVEDE